MSTDNRTERFAEMVIKWRWFVLATTFLVIALAGYGVQFLTMNSDYRVFFSKENPQLEAFDALQKKYTKDDNVFIAIEPGDNDVFSRETLSAIERLTEQAWTVPFAMRVDAVTNFQHMRAEGDDIFVEDLVEEAQNKSDSELQIIKQYAMQEPLLIDRLISERADIVGLNITLKFPGEKVGEELAATNAVRDLVAEFEQDDPDVQVYVSGMAMLFGAFNEAMERDMGNLMPMMFLVILIILVFTTRSISATLGSFLIVFLSIIAGMGAAGWYGIQFTAPIASAPTMIMTLAIADSIHILVTMLQSMRRGIAKREAIIESLKMNLVPVIITSVTTAIGFLSMNFSEVPPFRDLGNLTATGIMAACLFSITTLPALISILPVKVRLKASPTEDNRFIVNLGEFVIANRKKLLGVAAVLALGMPFLIGQNELNDEMIKYLDKTIQFRQDTDYVSERLTGIYTIEYSLSSGESGGVTNPQYLRTLEEFTYWFERQEHVIHVNSFSEVIKRINKSMHGDSLAYYNIPDARSQAAQFLLLYEMSLPYGLDLNNQINVNKSETRFVVTVDNMPSEALIALTEAGEQWLRQNAPAHMLSHGVSMPIVFAHLVRRQINSMLVGSVIALLLISAILTLVFRSFKFGLLSLIPNLAPIAFGFGIWGITKGQINGGLAIVFGMTMGIIVDDTVHFMSKYLYALRTENKNPKDAVRYAFSNVGRALIITSLVLFSGFIVLSQSSFGLFFDMARLTAITIVLALVIDIFVLPPLLILASSSRKKLQ